MEKTKKAVIIGATSGIGLATARQLHADGWEVGLAGRRVDRLEVAKSELGERVFTRKIDICEENAPAEMLALISEMDGVDLILLSSGVGFQNPLLDKSSNGKDAEILTVETNGLGFTRMILAAYRFFAEREHGHIAAISSIAGTKGLGASPAYSATKRMQNIYIQSLAQQAHMNGLDIKFTDIRPGFITTAMTSDHNYPMQLTVDYAARVITKALYKKKRIVYVDWRYAILVFFWRLIPNCIWERLNIKQD